MLWEVPIPADWFMGSFHAMGGSYSCRLVCGRFPCHGRFLFLQIGLWKVSMPWELPFPAECDLLVCRPLPTDMNLIMILKCSTDSLSLMYYNGIHTGALHLIRA